MKELQWYENPEGGVCLVKEGAFIEASLGEAVRVLQSFAQHHGFALVRLGPQQEKPQEEERVVSEQGEAQEVDEEGEEEDVVIEDVMPSEGASKKIAQQLEKEKAPKRVRA